MSSPYLCPGCKTNRSRYHLLEQHPQAVKLNPQTGEVMEEYSSSSLDPFHLPYKGTAKRVQCGSCGLIEDEMSFIKFAESHPAK
ncbi:DNA alkylation repair protein [Bacillus sp. FJAT-42376]|uniref:DNA alkylation repair protein n=1 Tax=Bacillus sp. FJAT-42376 TaxID=2014076 RepID=UPI000F4F1D09|nr:DNA alkylation repair protein [Bacillus sp. FJAT-42376]AZB43240.1 DNA alkylation repair protein [Bacillus sp. FJAT-42376]